MSLEAFQAMKYGPIGDAVMSAEPHTEADPVGVYAAILALWSGSIQGMVKMSDGRPIVTWTVLVGESALGRKGTSVRVASRMLNHSVKGFLDARTVGGVSSGPSLTQILYEKQEETDGTEDGIDTRTIVVDEEWSENLKRQNRCPTFASKLRSCWDGVTLRHITTKAHMVVQEPRLGFHAHITPAEWSEYIRPRDAKGGSYNRLLPVLVEGSKVLPYGHKEVYPEIEGLSEAYDWARRKPRSMSLNNEAARRFDELRAIFLGKMVDMPSHQTCYVERTPEQIIRVAAVLTATERKTVITRKAIDAAWAFVQYSMRSVEKLVREDTKPTGRVVKSVPELVREILAQEGGEVDRSRMLRRLGVRVTAASLMSAVESMSDVEMVKGETATGRGRPPVIYRFVTEKETQEEKDVAEAVPVSIPSPKTSSPDLALTGNWL
ncbi:hypothetical protein ASD97_26105 [Streptomyces sp. Root63]|uniref:DUF3987 domain-containing protein n=1 Tax=unclassified Streptomyces TaxID=2593676 RepID=UPI0007005ACC|nr:MULTISPECIES: DUF3987 domain-containing protein [unclassified Streptomyces]KQX43544.1 hypothetical protein ASD29_32405 [Streptomyces sp. Root1295]KRA34108.1 hypothetical protein ASD97_26105 [Streptomyces sp. Root63]